MRWHHYQRFIGVILVAWSLLFTSFAQAQALPAYNGRVNAAVGGIVSAKLGKWGFAANDPRITATASGIGTGLTTLAVGVATGAVATVGWPALLVAAGVSALVGGGVSLAVDGLYKWIFNSDGTVSTSSPGGSSGSPGGSGMVADGPFFQSGAYAAGDGETAAKEWAYKTWGANGVLNGGFYDSSGNYWFFIDYADSAEGHCAPYAHCRSEVSMKQNSGAPGNCAAGMVWDGTCRALSSLPPPSGVSNVSPTAAVQDIPAAELAKPMSNEMLAAAANAAWKAAATNAGGLPWSASDPITPADVAQWRAANPSAVPTVGDMTAPIASGSAVSVGPTSAPGGSTSPSTGPAATPGSGTQVDFGPNPNTPAPGLEATPTAQQILSPLLNLMPDLKAFAVPAHVGTCPTPSFVAFDKTYTFESHCGLVESNRSVIEAAMMLVWAIAAVFIVLRA